MQWGVCLLFVVTGLVCSLQLCSAENCVPSASCTNQYSKFVPDKERNCFCDEQCSLFNDCCADYEEPDDMSDTTAGLTREDIVGKFNCLNLPLYHTGEDSYYYVIDKCPSTYLVSFVRNACENPDEDDETSLSSIPVSMKTTSLVFRNVFCAICHGMWGIEGQSLRYWSKAKSCASQPSRTRTEAPDVESSGDMSVKEDLDSEHIFAVDGSVAHPDNALPARKQSDYSHDGTDYEECVTVYSPPPDSLTEPRLCTPHRATCADGSEKCAGPTNYVFFMQTDGKKKLYRNKECALCNNVFETNLRCLLGYDDKGEKGIVPDEEGSGELVDKALSMRILLAMETKPLPKCPPNAIIYKGACQEIFCQDGSKMNAEGRCSSDPTQVHVDLVNSPNNEGRGDLSACNCTYVKLKASEFIQFNNGSIYLGSVSRILTEREYTKLSNQTVAVCSDLLNRSHQQDFIDLTLQTHLVEDYLSLAGQLLSLVFLIIMFVVYMALKPLRNLPGNCLLSLAVALFLAQIFFLVMSLPKAQTWPCWLVATGTHYFYLAAFFWMNIMAFDIWRTFQFKMLSQSSRNTRVRFFGYSVYSWFTALIIVMVAVLSDLDYIPLPLYLRPQYAATHCWLNNKWGLLIFFAVPLAVLLLMNILLFLITVVNLCLASAATKFLSKSQRLSKRSHLILYIKLSAVMGLTWIFGYLANSSKDSQVMWYLFVVFNSLQGVIICIGFVCNRRVISLMRTRCQRRKSQSQNQGQRTTSTLVNASRTSPVNANSAG